MLLTVVWAFGHVLSAIAWLGGGILFTFFIGNRFSTLSLPSLREFLVKIQPGVLRFFQVVAGTTILFGVLLLFSMVNGDFSQFSPPSGWALYISLGMAVAIVAFVISEFVAVPRFRVLIRLAASVPEGSSAMPAEFPRSAQRAGSIALVLVILLLVTLGFMVAAGFA